VSTLDARIANLKAKLEQAKAQKAQQEARKRATDAKRRRSEDTRRKVLVGAVILSKVERGEWSPQQLHALLDPALTRADDRALFGLPVAETTTAPTPEATTA
jgi:multidrug resistance efflux pump